MGSLWGGAVVVRGYLEDMSVESRHAPFRQCRDARVHGHTTTAMHEIGCISPIEYTPPLPRWLGHMK